MSPCTKSVCVYPISIRLVPSRALSDLPVFAYITSGLHLPLDTFPHQRWHSAFAHSIRSVSTNLLEDVLQTTTWVLAEQAGNQ